jgi:hypothetical protein
MNVTSCRHPSCACAVSRTGGEFCSESCDRASSGGAGHAPCGCGHVACARRAAAVEHGAQSGRVGYLVLYLMGVPVGVLILLWVLFGNNLIGPG